MFCRNCSFPLDEGDRFCSRCGKRTAEEFQAEDSLARPLRRCKEQKKIAGVCEGFARYFDVDTTLVRIGWVGASVLPLSPGLAAYLICWAVMPKEQKAAQVRTSASS